MKCLPHEGLEKEIAELWKTLLKIDRVNRTDNFYDIGGDSLLVAQAVSKTKEAINVAKDVEWDRINDWNASKSNYYGFCTIFKFCSNRYFA